VPADFPEQEKYFQFFPPRNSQYLAVSSFPLTQEELFTERRDQDSQLTSVGTEESPWCGPFQTLRAIHNSCAGSEYWSLFGRPL
jgi:hypothetical protein